MTYSTSEKGLRSVIIWIMWLHAHRVWNYRPLLHKTVSLCTDGCNETSVNYRNTHTQSLGQRDHSLLQEFSISTETHRQRDDHQMRGISKQCLQSHGQEMREWNMASLTALIKQWQQRYDKREQCSINKLSLSKSGQYSNSIEVACTQNVR